MLATDGSMSQSWVADECRSQAILFLASGRGKGAGAASDCPEPLLAVGSPLRTLVSRRKAHGDGDATAKAIRSWVEETFHQYADQIDAGIPSAPWTWAELIDWWLAAGQALSGIDAHQRSALVRETRGENEPMHPTLWCAERFDRFSLCLDAFREETRSADWRTAGGSPNEYRRKLFAWVMSPDRKRREPAKDLKTWVSRLQGEMREIAREASDLFGSGWRLRGGGELSLATSDKWIARWGDARVGGRVFNEIRRPVVYPTAKGTRHLVKGVALLPVAQKLVSELVELQASDPVATGNQAALARATAFAHSRWQPNETFSKLWGKAAAVDSGILPVETVDRGFLAVARWLTVAWIVAEVDGPDALGGDRGEFVQAARIALALDGFQVRATREGQRPIRAIPHAAGIPDARESLVFSRDASAFEVPLGYLDEPASCPPALFAAIEAFDWRLWAFTAAPWNREEELTRAVLEILLRPQVLRSDDWEAIKQQALHISGGFADEEPLAKLVNFAHERRMAFELFRDTVYRDQPAGAMLDGLIQECRDLARESLAALVQLDPAALLRLEPPRRIDGSIDVPAWLARGGLAPDAVGDASPGSVIPHRLRWARESSPRGELLREQRAGNVVEVLISAGEATETELAVLNAPSVSASWHDEQPGEPAGRLADLLARFRATVSRSSNSVGGDALVGLRASLAGEAAAAFHELIARCRAGDEAALAWARIFKADPGFDFACHPGIDLEGGVLLPPCCDDQFLAWDFDATVPVGQDLEVRFALTPAHARRVISLGPRQSGSLADRAELLADACRKAGGSFARLGKEVRQATHRWLTFGAIAPHPAGTVEPLLDELLPWMIGNTRSGFVLRNSFIIAGSSTVLGLLLAVPAAFADLTLAPDFDAQAPTGTVVIRRFGLRGVHERPFSGAVSAGPAPAGFHEFREWAGRLGNSHEVGHTPSSGDLLRRADELAKHALAGTLALALPNLFDRLWETIASVPDTAGGVELESAAASLFEMLKGCCRMIPFEPAKMGEFPAGWVREADGTQPKGRRIKQLVRPGLRTVENVLVRPALVITE